MKIKVKLEEGAIMPTKATAGSAGWDLYSRERAYFEPGGVYQVDTGVAVEIPDNYVGLVFERSSLHTRKFSLINKVGVIDSDYRGTIKITLSYENWEKYSDNEWGIINYKDRIAQLVIVPAVDWELAQVEELSSTERGSGGFGSSGE